MFVGISREVDFLLITHNTLDKIDIDSADEFVPSDNKPLPDPMLSEICRTI